MKTTTLKIEGMQCVSCANTIKGLLDREPGVQMAAVSFEAGEARVLFDPKAVAEEQLVRTIERPGFRVVAQA